MVVAQQGLQLLISEGFLQKSQLPEKITINNIYKYNCVYLLNVTETWGIKLSKTCFLLK